MSRFFVTIMFFACSLMGFAHKTDANLDQALACLQEGKFEEAFQLMKRSASTNNVLSQFYLAEMYEYGIGVEINREEAFMMYRRAAERGLTPAMQDLARCYTEGIGVQPNPNRAKDWTERFNKRSDKDQDLADIVEIYNQAIKNPLLIAQNNTEKTSQENVGKTVSPSSAPSATINRKPIVTSDKSKDPTPLQSKKTEEKTSTLFYSDVDLDIPKTNLNNENTFAFIFANENYQDVSNVPYALRDGKVLAQYCNQTLGIPESNIHLVEDGTLNNIKRELNLMSKIAEAYKGEASFIIYYAGHGIPDEKTLDAYLLPVDGFTDDITTCYRLADLYDFIGDLPSQKNVVILDACFSGSTRGEGMLADARGVKLKSKTGLPSGNTLVLSSASGDETSYPLDDQQHGLFTYFLLKKLKEGRGNVALGSLAEYLKENVTKSSLVKNSRQQSPMATPSENVAGEWINWKLTTSK